MIACSAMQMIMGQGKREEAKDAPLPKHGKRLFIQASLFRQNEYGRNRQKSMHLGSMSGIGPAGHPRDAPRQIEAKGAPLPKHGPGQVSSRLGLHGRHPQRRVRRDPQTPVGPPERTYQGSERRWASSRASRVQIFRTADDAHSASPGRSQLEIWKVRERLSGYLPVAWLIKHNPEIDWETGVLKWRSQYCKHHCIPVSMRDAVRNFVKMLRESKVWEVDGPKEADGPKKVDGPKEVDGPKRGRWTKGGRWTRDRKRRRCKRWNRMA
jgi:hypothetical protein